MSTGLIDIIKRAAIEAEDNRQPCDLRFGTVTSKSPLKVQITNQFTIPESLLIVPRHLTDYTVKVSFNWETELAGEHDHSYSGTTYPKSGGSGESAFSSHSHGYSGTVKSKPDHKHVVKSNKEKELTVHNALEVGDKVALIRKTGGQVYYILDRI
jgi:L-asparaginase/Glu-tRNA(Gln) amidotransferase subunit D